MTSSVEVIQYQEATTTKFLKDGLYPHAEEIDNENQSVSSGSSEHLQNNNYTTSPIDEKKNGAVAFSDERQLTEEKENSHQEPKKTNSLLRRLKRDGKHTESEKTAQEEKKSEGLVRTISGMFTHKPKSEKEKRKDNADNNKNRPSLKNSNDSETKSRNRRSFIFFSDNEDEVMEQQAKKNKKANSSDFSTSDNEDGKSKNIKQKHRLSLNLDRFLRHDDNKHKSFNNNDITDMFLPETNNSTIRTYKGRLDSSGSNRTPTATVLDSSHQTESPILHTVPSTPNGVVNSTGMISESVREDFPEAKVGSIEERSDEFKDEIGYSSANSVNEDRSINEQQQKSRPISQVSSSSLNSEKNEDNNHYNNQAEAEVNDDSKPDRNVNDEITDIKSPISINVTKSSTIFSHHQEEPSTVTTAPQTPPKFPATPGFVEEEIKHVYLSHNIEQDRELENNVDQNGQIHRVEETSQILPSLSQVTETQIDITRETPQIRQKSLINVRKQLESFKATNESLNNIKNQLESKIDEQSQQNFKLSSLESIMTRQLEMSQRMEETMRRLETKVNQQKEELDGLLAGRMEDTVRRLEYKLDEQNKELEGLKQILGQLQMAHPQQLLIEAEPANQFSSSTAMTIAAQHPRDTLVHTFVVKPLVNTIVYSARITTSVMYAVYVRPVVGLVKAVRG
ncbi:17097_t:CDS:2 [Dentiscutata heterogama]|uniref:17097_t:CDS:1 n=1 Tax=Dentiscutata heterogama TaxID=1316150 RepID=A0ACA9JXZ9_9GLOM|nr:17097_t:CDS:2 [Dentiscutata heterogama]